MQLSQTLSSAIAQIKVSNSPMTNHTKKILPQHRPFFNFCITLQIVLMGEGFPFLFCLWLLLLLKKDFASLLVIRFARVSSHVVDFNARNKSLTAKLLQ